MPCHLFLQQLPACGAPAWSYSYRYTGAAPVGGTGATPTKAQGTTLRSAGVRPSCATVFVGVAPVPPKTPRPRCLIEIRPMDRETARRNMRAGLVAGGIAAGIFALSFVAAFLYIAPQPCPSTETSRSRGR